MHLKPWHTKVVTAVVLGLGLAAALVAVGVVFGGAGHGDDLWFEVARSGVSLGVIAVLGGIIGFLLREVDNAREDARREGEFLRAFYMDIRDAYLDLKDVRRRFRAAGVRHTVSGESLPTMRVDEIRGAWRELGRAQLKFESSARAVHSEPDRYPSPLEVREALRRLEKFGHAVVAEWEDMGESVWPGCDSDVLMRLKMLREFATPRSQGSRMFEEEAASQMDIITRAFFPQPKRRGRR